MPSDPALILGFDSSAAHCAAALLSGDRLLDSACEEMSRGQAERLMPMLAEMLARHDRGWGDLSALGVGIGPGNFTGIRIAVSAARGLALGLGIPAVGVSGCEARARLIGPGQSAAIPAPQGMVYLCPPEDGLPKQVAASGLDASVVTDFAGADLAEAIARTAALRRHHTATPPAPLYLRPADAAPARDLPPVMLD